MTHPYAKREIMQNRDLTAAERLEPARAALRFAAQLLQQFERVTLEASDRLTENQLEIICRAADQAYRAAENAAFLGNSEFHAHPLDRVEWEDK